MRVYFADRCAARRQADIEAQKVIELLDASHLLANLSATDEFAP
jgi:hypothetical protein